MLPTMVTVMADSVTDWNGVTSTMLEGVFTEIKSLLPMVAPVIVSFIGFRKAWSFIRSAIAGA